MIPPPSVAVPSSGAKPTIRHVPPFPSVLLRRTKDPRIIMGRKEGKSMHFFPLIAGARPGDELGGTCSRPISHFFT